MTGKFIEKISLMNAEAASLQAASRLPHSFALLARPRQAWIACLAKPLKGCWDAPWPGENQMRAKRVSSQVYKELRSAVRKPHLP